jgi:hypothetical protein
MINAGEDQKYFDAHHIFIGYFSYIQLGYGYHHALDCYSLKLMRSKENFKADIHWSI